MSKATPPASADMAIWLQGPCSYPQTQLGRDPSTLNQGGQNVQPLKRLFSPGQDCQEREARLVGSLPSTSTVFVGYQAYCPSTPHLPGCLGHLSLPTFLLPLAGREGPWKEPWPVTGLVTLAMTPRRF